MNNEATSQLAERVERQFFGKYRGVVVNNKDPLKLGRLKLYVPSVIDCSGTTGDSAPADDSDERVTDWAWPCVPFGGIGEQGMFFIPDEKAQVWVEFEEGNLDLPVWVGTVWSRPGGTSQIPTEAQNMQQDKPQRRVFKTASGHVMEFSDVPGEETITITHKDGARIMMDEKGSVVIANKEGSHIYLNADDGEATMIDQNGNNIRLSSDGITLTNKDGSVVDMAGGSVQVVAKNVHVRSETVSLGEGAMEPAILGTSFAAMYDAHTHVTAWGPSGPPIPAPMPLSAPANPAISKVVKVK
jgi:hypothetical protein